MQLEAKFNTISTQHLGLHKKSQHIKGIEIPQIILISDAKHPNKTKNLLELSKAFIFTRNELKLYKVLTTKISAKAHKIRNK